MNTSNPMTLVMKAGRQKKYYPFPLHKMAVFQNGRSKNADGLENAELACKNVLSLPIEPLQGEEITAGVIEAVSEALKNP